MFITENEQQKALTDELSKAQLEYEAQLANELEEKAKRKRAIGEAYSRVVKGYKDKYFFEKTKRVYYHNNPDLFVEIRPDGTVLLGCDAGDFKPSITEAKSVFLQELDEIKAVLDKQQKKEDKYYKVLGMEHPTRTLRAKKEETNE